MDSLDLFFKKYSYKFDKGYPDMNSEKDVLLLESILLNELGIKMSQNEEDVKMRESKIKFLQNELAEARQFISTKSGYISVSSQIIL